MDLTSQWEKWHVHIGREGIGGALFGGYLSLTSYFNSLRLLHFSICPCFPPVQLTSQKSPMA